jgi:DHA1 family inner membrane transport protein
LATPVHAPSPESPEAFARSNVPDAAVAAGPGVTEAMVYSADDIAPPLPHRRAVWSLVVLAFAAFVFSCNEGSMLGMISVIAADMGRSEAALGLMTTVFAVVNMLLSIPAALTLQRFPRKWVLSGTVVVLAVGMVVVAAAQDFGWLLAGRGITAVGHAAFWAIVTPTVAGMFASKQRGKSMSRLLLGGSAAFIIGVPALTIVSQNVGWRIPYAVLAGMAVALALAIVLVMPSFRAEQGTAARGLFPSWAVFARILVVCGLSVAAVSLTWTYITPFATEVAGFAASTVPTLLFLGGIAGFTAMYLVGRHLDRFPVKSVAFGMALLLSMWATMALFGSVPAVLVACVLLQGFAWSVLIAAMVNWAIRHAPGSTDTANGTYATVFSAGNASGSLVGAALLAAVGAAWLPVASLVVTVGAAVLVWTMRGVGVARRA